MKRWIAIAAIIGAVSGCLKNTGQSRAEAYKRWHHTRAQMLCGVAQEHLNVGQLDHARSKVTEALALDENYAKARLLLARVLVEQGHYRQAVGGLEPLCQAHPKSPEAVYLLGIAQEKDGKLADALVSYRRAHALDENHLDAVMAAAEVLVTMGRIRQAQLYVESFMDSADGNPGMQELAGRLAMMSGEYARAAGYYQDAFDLDYKNPAYREALGRAQYRAGSFEDAAETLKPLTETKERQAADWIYTMLGDCYVAMNRPTYARDAYQVASERSPSDAAVWVNLATAELALNDESRAILSARQALQIDPDRLDATIVLGYALLRSGQATRAIRLLTQTAAQHTGNSVVQCLLGWAHSLSGNSVEALRCFDVALRLDPNNRLARELRDETGPKRLSKIE